MGNRARASFWRRDLECHRGFTWSPAVWAVPWELLKIQCSFPMVHSTRPSRLPYTRGADTRHSKRDLRDCLEPKPSSETQRVLPTLLLFQKNTILTTGHKYMSTTEQLFKKHFARVTSMLKTRVAMKGVIAGLIGSRTWKNRS